MKFHHVGIVVHKISDKMPFMKDILKTNITTIPFHDKIQKVNVSFLKMGDFSIELIEPAEEITPITNFLAKRGEGIHHLAFEVDDIKEKVKELCNKGGKIICSPDLGFENRLISFVYLDAFPGKIIEIISKRPLKI